MLERGEPPDGFLDSVRTVETERAGRRRWRDDAGDVAPDAVPRLAAGVAVSVSPVLGEGEFVWGHVITSQTRPEGTPCSALVAELLKRVDGATPVSELLRSLRAQFGARIDANAERAVLTALGVLYVDGVVEGLDSS